MEVTQTFIVSELSSFRSFKTGWITFKACEVPSFFKFENPLNLLREDLINSYKL